MMPKIVPHGTKRMPRTQTTVDRGHDRGFAQRNETEFSAEIAKKRIFFSSSEFSTQTLFHPHFSAISHREKIFLKSDA